MNSVPVRNRLMESNESQLKPASTATGICWRDGGASGGTPADRMASWLKGWEQGVSGDPGGWCFGRSNIYSPCDPPPIFLEKKVSFLF